MFNFEKISMRQFCFTLIRFQPFFAHTKIYETDNNLSVSPYTTFAPQVGCWSTILMALSRVSRAFLTILSPI